MDQPMAISPECRVAEPAPRVLEGEEARADAELAQCAAEGDTDCWNRLFDRFAPWAYRFALAHLDRNHADAQDLCADIMLTAASGIGRYNPRRGSLDAWMSGLARHRLSHFCRKRHRHVPLVPEPSGGDDACLVGDPADDALTRITVQRALACLPERQSSVLLSKYVEGHSTEEIARMACTTPAAIESLLSRGRAAFRSAFAALCDTHNRGDKP